MLLSLTFDGGDAAHVLSPAISLWFLLPVVGWSDQTEGRGLKTNSTGVRNRWPQRGEGGRKKKKTCKRKKEQWLKAAANETSFTEGERRVNGGWHQKILMSQPFMYRWLCHSYPHMHTHIHQHTHTRASMWAHAQRWWQQDRRAVQGCLLLHHTLWMEGADTAPPPPSYTTTTTTATSTLILQYTHTLWQLHLPLDKHYYPKYTHWRLTPAHERKHCRWPFFLFFPPFTAFLRTARMQKFRFFFFKYLPAFVSFLKVHSLNFLKKPGLEDTVKGLPLTPGARSSLMVYT